MIDEVSIQVAIEALLINTSVNINGVQWIVVWGNDRYDKQAPLLRGHYMPVSSDSLSMQGGDRSFKGIYQITVVVPAGAGTQNAYKVARFIANAFDSATDPQHGGIPVGDGFISRMQPATVSAGYNDEIGYNVPVSIRYIAY